MLGRRMDKRKKDNNRREERVPVAIPVFYETNEAGLKQILKIKQYYNDNSN